MRSVGLFFGLVLACVAGCGSPRAAMVHQGPYPIDVVCTTGMVADLVRNVGGEHVSVKQLMGEGVDPHRYKASPGDITLLSQAHMIFYSGRNLEGKMTDVFVRLARQKPTVAVTDAIDEGKVLEDAEQHYDPHLWFDVALWSQAVDAVRDVLVAYDPPHADEYRKNTATYQARLAELDGWVRSEMATIPKEQRVLVTAHDAFGYFGRAYEVEVRGIQGISTESEAGVKQINDLVQFLADRRIKAVFVETSVSEKNIKALIEGCRNERNHSVVIGGELFSDAMGKPGTEDGTYEGMIRHNVTTIVRSLR